MFTFFTSCSPVLCECRIAAAGLIPMTIVKAEIILSLFRCDLNKKRQPILQEQRKARRCGVLSAKKDLFFRANLFFFGLPRAHFNSADLFADKKIASRHSLSSRPRKNEVGMACASMLVPKRLDRKRSGLESKNN